MESGQGSSGLMVASEMPFPEQSSPGLTDLTPVLRVASLGENCLMMPQTIFTFLSKVSKRVQIVAKDNICRALHFYFVCMSVLLVYISVHHVNAVPLESRRGNQILRSWTYRQVLTAV